MNKPTTFESLMNSVLYHHDLRNIFEDFLTLSLCAFSFNPQTQKSHEEELYLETIDKYAKEETQFLFPKLLAALVVEMENQNNAFGTDVLGNYYELNFSKKRSSQYFTPWHICEFMSRITSTEHVRKPDGSPIRILDPACGSGRMLLAGAKNFGRREEYYGIDIDPTCVKMTAMNLFLNGLFDAEVMCADALSPVGFKFSYRTSFLPLGVFKITNKEDSKLWHLHQQSFAEQFTTAEKAKTSVSKEGLILPSKQSSIIPNDGSQLTFF
jgi:type I restriction-modification system DNA methylase subunit